MPSLQVLGSVQVVQYRTCGYHALRQVIHTKALEVLHAELLHQALLCRLAGHHPVIELEGEVLIAKRLFHFALLAPDVQHLFRCEVHQQFVHIVRRAFCHQVFACGYI